MAGIVVLLAAVAVSACDDPSGTSVVAGDLADLEADGVIYGMDDYLETDGIRSGRVRADSAYVYNDSSVIHLWGMYMTLYHEDGSDRAQVSSLAGTMNQRTEKMVARGDVVVNMAGTQERIETPELHYDPSANQIWSDSATTRILPSGRRTSGTCFRSTLELEDIRICNPRGAVGVPEQERGRGGQGGEAGEGGQDGEGGEAEEAPGGGEAREVEAGGEVRGGGGGGGGG